MLGKAIEEQFQDQRSGTEGYAGEVFLDRDRHECPAGDAEPNKVASYYHRCRQEAEGCMAIGDERIWLLGYQWPNQGGNAEKKCQADLVGLATDGGLVVFECKLGSNPEPPLVAAVQGLDYLAHLLRQGNFERIDRGFDAWRNKPGKVIPQSFEDVRPRNSEDAKPLVVVLAPEAYFRQHSGKSRRGEGWQEFVTVADEVVKSVRICFATTDFDGTTAEWVVASNYAPTVNPAVRDRDHCPPGSGQPALLLNGEQVPVRVIRRGPRNTRVRLPDGTTRLVPNEELRWPS